MLLNRNQFVLTLHVRHSLNKSGNMQWSDTIREYILIFIFNNKFNNKKLSMTVVIMTCCSAWIDLKNATFLLIILYLRYWIMYRRGFNHWNLCLIKFWLSFYQHTNIPVLVHISIIYIIRFNLLNLRLSLIVLNWNTFQKYSQYLYNFFRILYMIFKIL